MKSLTTTLFCLLFSGFASAQTGSPAGPVPADLLARRRAALAQRVGDGVVVMRAAQERSIEGDYPQDSDFRQENDFFYLTGIEAADAWLVLSVRQGTAAARLYLPQRNPAQEQWTGVKLGPGAEAERLSGISDVRATDRLKADLAQLLGAPDSPARVGGVLVHEPFRLRAICPRTGGERLACVSKEVVPADVSMLTLKSLNPHVAVLRLIKDEDEIKRLRRTVQITTDAHRAALENITPGMWEYEIEALIEYEFRRRGAERLAFPSIVGSGPNSTVLHYDKSRRRTQPGDLIVIDIGSEFGYYAADVTRTVPASGRFTPRQRALYDLVLGAQQAAMNAVKPGITMGELNQIARDFMQANSRDLCGPDSCDKYFIHGLGHWLGMDVHDVGSYNVPLAAGMVLTIEPGIYIAKENIGIRIEDDILVTPNGYELLSSGAPRKAAEIEALMAKARPRT